MRLFLKVSQYVTRWGFVQAIIEKKTEHILIEQDKKLNMSTIKKTFKIPDNGMTPEKVHERLNEFCERDAEKSRTSKISGSIYIPNDKKFEQGMMEFTKNFIYANPLHFDQFPAVRQMEAEVIRMTGDFFGQERESIGIMTSGGTESIVLSMLAYRNWARDEKGITEPNMYKIYIHPISVIPETAHVAFIRACEYLVIDCRKAAVHPDTQKANVKNMKKLIDSNTIALVASAPSYGAGAFDPVEEIAALAQRKNIGCHVDACLGGFIIAFRKDKLPKFDFSVEGVTSLSCDHHKFGLSPKGASVVLFRTKALRRKSIFAYSEWSGGLYTCTSMAGSRGAIGISGAWYAMVSIGRKRYTEMAQQIVDAVQNMATDINKIPELEVLGTPEVCVVAFKSRSKKIDIYCVNQCMVERGWSLSTVQNPSAIHISVTHQNAANWKLLIKEIQEVVQEIKANPSMFKGGSAGAIYGTTQSVTDKRIVDESMRKIIECTLKI